MYFGYNRDINSGCFAHRTGNITISYYWLLPIGTEVQAEVVVVECSHPAGTIRIFANYQ